MRRGLLCLTLLLGAAGSGKAGEQEIELGLENFAYRTAETLFNRGNVLALDEGEDLLRGTLRFKRSLGDARVVVSGFVERRLGRSDATETTLRQAYLQYGWGEGLTLRLGKQRIGWGSGFAWNPTSRVEPPKNALNTSLEQQGAEAVRMDLIPVTWAGLVLVAARSEVDAGDLPFDRPRLRRRTAAVRARLLLADTDLALVFSGGKNQRTLVGFDLARDVRALSLHAEGAFYRGAALPPARDAETFFRLVAGLLHTRGDHSLTLEYFYNGEGYTDASAAAFFSRLEASSRLPDRQAYLAAVGVPFVGGLGLRRHYLQGSWSRGSAGGKWTLSTRGTVALSDGGIALTPGLVYAPRGNVTLHGDAVLLLGRKDSEYGHSPLRGLLATRIRVLF
jgi:hypothetical protein